MKLLGRLWQAWKRFGQFLGDLLARIVLTLFYFTVLVPFGLGVRLLSDPLRTQHSDMTSLWVLRHTGDQSLDEARRQF